jgi:hypothetical protein
LVVYPPRQGLLEALADPFGAAALPLSVSRVLGIPERETLAALTAPLRLFRRGEPLAMMPNVFLR